jgi:hypothetical protein
MSNHILENMISDGPSFPSQIETLVHHLIKELEAPLEQPKYTLDELELIEEIVRRKTRPLERNNVNILLPLVAYVSEVGRRLTSGHFQMRLDDTGKIWEPWIIGDEGEEYDFFLNTFKQFCDISDENASIVGSITGLIKSTKLFP